MTARPRTFLSLPSPLRLLVALIVLVAGTASSATVVGAETGVAANHLETAAAVAVDADIPAGHVGSEPIAFDDWTSGCCVAPRTAGLADEAVTTGRTASTSWGRTVQDFQQYGDQWRRVSAHAETATGRAYRGGTSIEEVFERGADRLIRHRIYGPDGDILHETFRPYAKFGAP